MANRLAGETSPYLQQHKDNPVDWYPWGPEAFERAEAEDKPVLLSIGYSACHWCHVMAHESFEDDGTAAVMNDLFVNVKVDREERPDVDAIYMDATQAMTGSGGWPMTVFLTPDQRPFFAGTYFPKRSMHGRAGFVDLLNAIADAWRNRRDEIEQQADQLSSAVRARSTLDALELGGADDRREANEVFRAAYETLRASFDPEWGGFGRAPKFPQATFLELVFRAYAHNRSPDTLRMIETTLDAMASGGIYDHVGGGFSRYSVDPYWMVPHFEKMLYDQAQLLRAYTHGWQLTEKAEWQQVVAEIVSYVFRDLRDAQGGVYSAEDADSEGVEGKFYVWSIDEMRHVGGDVAVDWYGATEEGNFEGSNIPFRPQRGDLLRPHEVEGARALLFDARAKRVRPGLDDKVLTEWNAMFVGALAEAGAAFERDDWISEATRTADFLLRTLRREDGRWLRSWQRGRANERLLAYAVDYAWLTDAFTRLAEATGEARWIQHASDTASSMIDLFEDRDGGGFFTTGRDAEVLLVRQKEYYDGATPSANGIAVNALLRLGALTGRDQFLDAAQRAMEWLEPAVRASPQAFTTTLAAMDTSANGTIEIVIPGRARGDLVRAVQRQYLPRAVLAWGEPYPSPLWEGRDEGVAYVCRNYACQLPVSDADGLIEQVRR